jgi:hypothetical protein
MFLQKYWHKGAFHQVRSFSTYACITSSHCCRTKIFSRATTLQRLRNQRWMSLSFHKLCR